MSLPRTFLIGLDPIWYAAVVCCSLNAHTVFLGRLIIQEGEHNFGDFLREYMEDWLAFGRFKTDFFSQTW